MVTTDITKSIRKDLTILKQFNYKISVQKYNYSSISIEIIKSPFLKKNKISETIIKFIENTANKYQYCTNYDHYGDYGSSYNIYISTIDFYKPEIKQLDKDFENFVLKDWQEKQKKLDIEIEAKKQKQFKEFKKQEKINEENQKIAAEKEKQQIKIIENSINIKELNKNEYYIIENVQYPNLNKNNTLKQYEEEKKDSTFTDTEIREEINFNNIEAYNYFCNMLLNDFDFINQDCGGHYFVDNRFTDIIDYNYMSEEEKQKTKWNNIGIVIKLNNKIKFVVNNEGYNYCRYVGFVENELNIQTKKVKIENLCSVENQEIEKNKEKALNLIDISASEISKGNLKSLTKMDKAEKQIYFNYMTIKLNELNFELTKEIIRLIPQEYTLFKQTMYELYFELKNI
jgi:hypothetical protein